MIPSIWMIPTFLGDVRLRAMGDGSKTLLVSAQVTLAEKAALEKVREHALKKKWTERWPEWTGSSLPDVMLDVAIGKVAPLLARALKPGRKVVSAVRFEDGHMIEVADAATQDDGERGSTVVSAKLEKAVATSVAAPHRGCPAPDFAKAEIQARDVLAMFLSPEQLEDFRKYNRFISVGATTGHRYMITSRHARDALAKYQRTLYDLDEERALCVHDWDLPASEEMLALHVCVSLPGYESYVRFLEA